MRIVVQDVAQRVPHFERRFQRTCVVTVGKHGATSSELAIDRSRDANAQALKASRESPTVSRLRDDVDVIALNGVLTEAKAEALAPPDERPMNSQKQAATTQARQALPHAQRNVQRRAGAQG